MLGPTAYTLRSRVDALQTGLSISSAAGLITALEARIAALEPA
jgi:hypothetical protein